ncbi:MAG: nitroreductase family protein [Aquabacterium sp.]|uniref:nitroreductase family protein n=1 Tax=Aquabacterium sp. TaxID=1872578 RepID=UPI003BAE7E39
MSGFKSFVWKVMPAGTHRLLRNVYFSLKLIPNVIYDSARFLKYSGLNKSHEYQGEQAARITMFYHQIEKGLSLSAPRPGFGMTVIPQLLNMVEAYIARYGYVRPATTAIGALREYIEFNDRAGFDVPYVKERVHAILAKSEEARAGFSSWEGGVISVQKSDLEKLQGMDFEGFFKSRYSIRNFAGGEIPVDDLRRVVEISQKTPSVCNRQSVRVHAYRDRSKIDQILAIQSGSRGFGDKASAVLVVTSELQSFVDVGERYQGWIDGGMFSMSICLAFHHLGYGSCCLNWSKEKHTDKALRELLGLQPSELIIMVIAAGTLPEQLSVAHSPRPGVDAVLSIH